MRYVIVILGLVLLIGGLVAIKGSQIGMLIGMGEAMKKSGPPPEVVSTAITQKQVWETTLSAVGSVVTAKGVALSNDAPGLVSRIHFESGDTVKQGAVLVELDTSVERAQLASLQAKRDLAQISVKRSTALATSGAVAQSQVDADASSFKSLSADAGALSAQIARKVIRAPFSGKLGIRQVNLGQYLSPGTTVTTLEAEKAIFVDFSLPQQELAKLRVGMTVRAMQSGSTGALGEGTISAIDPAVDPITRNIKVRASLPDIEDKLRPGMFLRIDVVMPEKSEVVAVPQTAIVHASYGDSVFTGEEKPGPDGKPRKVAQQHFVKVGAARGDFIAVVDGLKENQEVVTAGAFKLRNGIPLTVNNKGAPPPQLDPRPENR
ncbi:MAG: efflux RND transporter periplasmic adaptor subunit [Myxococcales bacterium]|nr:MAG: efflux RND transporter periplasmic adaptor subunit [Myxococcales bacterium]